MANAKIDIKVGELEISLEGTERFVEDQYNKITGQLEAFQTVGSEVTTEREPAKTEKQKAKVVTSTPYETKGTTPKSKKRGRPKKSTGRAKTTKTAKKAKPSKTAKATSLPKDFGEWLKMAPKKMNKTDKALLAGFYVQLNSDKGSFRVREASKVLKNNNINLSNTSIFIRNNLSAKKLFQHSKTGSEPNYRLTDKGLEHIKELLGV